MLKFHVRFCWHNRKTLNTHNFLHLRMCQRLYSDFHTGTELCEASARITVPEDLHLQQPIHERRAPAHKPRIGFLCCKTPHKPNQTKSKPKYESILGVAQSPASLQQSLLVFSHALGAFDA